MPTYAYRCTECNEEFDIYQRFDEESLTDCPTCDGRLRKLFSPSGIVFKGQGFYRTDSRSSPNGPPSSGKPSASGDSSSTGKSSTGTSSTGKSSTGTSSSSAKSSSTGSKSD